MACDHLLGSISRRSFKLDNAAMVVNDREISLVVRTALECAGFGCAEFNSTLSLLRGIKGDDLRLIVLDIDAEADWRCILEWRRNWLNPAVVVIAIGSADTGTTVDALEAGADDYVAKPVRGAELVARIHAAQRRRDEPTASGSVSLAGYTIDRDTCCLRTAGSHVSLTGRELALIQILFENVGKLVTRQRLATEVWGANADLSGRTIEQHVYQVRRKLRLCAGQALCVRSIYGCGYRLELSPTEPARAVPPPAKARRPVNPQASSGASLQQAWPLCTPA
jgi:DNA-binding response OmpR family regulator